MKKIKDAIASLKGKQARRKAETEAQRKNKRFESMMEDVDFIVAVYKKISSEQLDPSLLEHATDMAKFVLEEERRRNDAKMSFKKLMALLFGAAGTILTLFLSNAKEIYEVFIDLWRELVG